MVYCCYRNAINSQAFEKLQLAGTHQGQAWCWQHSSPASSQAIVVCKEWNCPEEPHCDNVAETSSLSTLSLGLQTLQECWVGVQVCKGRSQSASFGAWRVTADSSPTPVGSTGAPTAAPHTEPKQLNEDFSFRAVSQVLLQRHILSSLSLSFSPHRQINSRDSKPGTKHWHIKKHTDKPSLSSSQEFGDSEKVSFVEESSPASKLFFLKGPHLTEYLAATGYSPEYCIILVIGN